MPARILNFLLVLVLLLPLSASAETSAISLPAPKKEGAFGVETALATRRAIRSYAKQALTLSEVAQLLWAAQGVTGPDGKRTAPSARHLYPLEVAVVAQNVEGLPRGAYRYVPARHALEILAPAKEGELLLAKATSQAQVKEAPAVFVIAAVYERMYAGPRNHVFTDFEAGLASENLLLEAVAMKLGAVVTGGIDPVAAKEGVGFRGTEEVIVIIPVGHLAD